MRSQAEGWQAEPRGEGQACSCQEGGAGRQEGRQGAGQAGAGCGEVPLRQGLALQSGIKVLGCTSLRPRRSVAAACSLLAHCCLLGGCSQAGCLGSADGLHCAAPGPESMPGWLTLYQGSLAAAPLVGRAEQGAVMPRAPLHQPCSSWRSRTPGRARSQAAQEGRQAGGCCGGQAGARAAAPGAAQGDRWVTRAPGTPPSPACLTAAVQSSLALRKRRHTLCKQVRLWCAQCCHRTRALACLIRPVCIACRQDGRGRHQAAAGPAHHGAVRWPQVPRGVVPEEPHLPPPLALGSG